MANVLDRVNNHEFLMRRMRLLDREDNSLGTYPLLGIQTLVCLVRDFSIEGSGLWSIIQLSAVWS